MSFLPVIVDSIQCVLESQSSIHWPLVGLRNKLFYNARTLNDQSNTHSAGLVSNLWTAQAMRQSRTSVHAAVAATTLPTLLCIDTRCNKYLT